MNSLFVIELIISIEVEIVKEDLFMIKNWLENEPKETLICAVTSVIALVLSITGVLKNILPIDIAWVAIILCGISSDCHIYSTSCKRL